MKKVEMVKAGTELMVTIGVGTLVGGAIAIVKPQNLNVIKNIAVSMEGMVITSIDEVVGVIKEIIEKRKPKEETEEVEEVQA